MTDQDLEALTGWIRERMPGYRLHRKSRNGMHVFEVREGKEVREGEEEREGEADAESLDALLVLPARFSDGSDWPSLAELQRALETASVPSLLTKGRRLRLRADEQEEMRKIWVEDVAPAEG